MMARPTDGTSGANRTLLPVEISFHNLFETVEGLVAIGTIALALATAGLALSTRRVARSTDKEVKAVGEQIELSRQATEAVERQAASTEAQVVVARASVEATFRPVLTNLPLQWQPFAESSVVEYFRYPNGPMASVSGTNRSRVRAEEQAKYVYLSLPVRNVGSGVAFITGLSLLSGDRSAEASQAANAIVPPQETTRLQFSLLKGDREGEPQAQFRDMTVTVAYRDLGGHGWFSRFDLVRQADSSGWYVSQVFVNVEGAPDSDAVGSGPMFEV
jgi:hypothetical protein